MKRCTKCGQNRPLHEFNVHRGKKNRHSRRPVLQSWCRDCSKAHKRDYMRRKRAEAKRQAQEES